jgi:opacity protein-like surface antigen
MKKLVLVLVIAGSLAGGAWAQDEQKAPKQGGFSLSAGAGGYFTSDFGGGVEASAGGQTMSIKTPYAGGGGFAFFDATYAELSFGFFGGGGTMKIEFPGSPDQEMDFSLSGLDIGLLGKYPIAVGEKLTVFPLLGITYRVVLSLKAGNGTEWKNSDGDKMAGDFSALWFKLGGGLDYAFTDHVFLRANLLYGLRLANKLENDRYESMIGTIPDEIDVKPLLGHGLEVKVAVGYKF